MMLSIHIRQAETDGILEGALAERRMLRWRPLNGSQKISV